MSRGTPIVPVRIDEELQEAVELAIARRNLWTAREPWKFSHFVRVAVLEKLKKMERSRRRRPRRKKEGGEPVSTAVAP